MKLLMPLLALAAFQIPTALADCHVSTDAATQAVFYNNDSDATGELLANDCLDYFFTYSKPEVLPVVNGKVTNVKMHYRVDHDGMFDVINLIMKNTPATKTRIEIAFTFEPDMDGTHLIRVELSPKPNYGK